MDPTLKAKLLELAAVLKAGPDAEWKLLEFRQFVHQLSVIESNHARANLNSNPVAFAAFEKQLERDVYELQNQ